MDFKILKGDILDERADAVVLSANPKLKEGRGVLGKKVAEMVIRRD